MVMKELSIEEKAKAYDEAVKKLRNAFYDNNSRMCEEYRNAVLKTIEPVFPELAESEDEKIRKSLIKLVKQAGEGYENITEGVSIQKAVAYLEKQGEQKPVDNKLPEFKDKLCELFQRFRWYKDETPTNGDILEYVEAHIQELLGVVNEQNPAWSKEDEISINEIIETLNIVQANRLRTQKTHYNKATIDKDIAFLKSLKERYRWKPSEEQMGAIKGAVRRMK